MSSYDNKNSAMFFSIFKILLTSYSCVFPKTISKIFFKKARYDFLKDLYFLSLLK